MVICRHGEQYVRTVRGELRKLPGQAGQMHQLRASFGHVWKQVLRGLPPVHIRDTRLQLRSLSFHVRDLQRNRREPMHLLSTWIVFSQWYACIYIYMYIHVDLNPWKRHRSATDNLETYFSGIWYRRDMFHTNSRFLSRFPRFIGRTIEWNIRRETKDRSRLN